MSMMIETYVKRTTSLVLALQLRCTRCVALPEISARTGKMAISATKSWAAVFEGSQRTVGYNSTLVNTRGSRGGSKNCSA